MSTQQALIDIVCGAYKKRQSIRGTALETGISESKVRKILITQGLYTTPLIDRIRELYNAGMDVAHIAKMVNLSSGAVSGSLPYKRPAYGSDNPSVNAARIRKYRAKLKQSVDKPQTM